MMSKKVLESGIGMTYMREISLNYSRCNCSTDGDGIEDHDDSRGVVGRRKRARVYRYGSP